MVQSSNRLTLPSKSGGSLLDDLEPLLPYENAKTTAYKTVETFSGITQRKLWLKHDENGPARTDGHCITVDMNDENMYLLVEHELSHILFKSDSVAKAKFVATYSQLVVSFAKEQGQTVDVDAVCDLVDLTLNIVEDRRVDSLWGLLYSGSAALQRKRHRDTTQAYALQCHSSYLLYFVCVEGGATIQPGPMDAYRSLFETVLKRVEYRGFLVSLVLAKWLITELIAEIVRQTLVPPSTPGSKDDPKDTVSSGSAEERVAALVEVLKCCSVPADLRAEKDDVRPSTYKERGADSNAKRLVDTALRINLSDSVVVEDLLATTQREMEGIVARAKTAVRPPTDRDDWLRKDSMAKVVFHDVKKADSRKKAPLLSLGDQEIIRKLRSIFSRVTGKRRARLEDCGLEVDVQALIERRISGNPSPVFRQETRGHGFETIVLLDRSSSMDGPRTTQAERACRLLGRALKFPFVTTSVWGFQSLEPGQVDIVRYDPSAEVHTSPVCKVDGSTPLHKAIQLATRFLEHGSAFKHLFILTDGEPRYFLKGDKRVSTAQLRVWVRDEVRHARSRGIHVTCLMIGTRVSSADLGRMFGSSAFWKKGTDASFDLDLINLVSGSFVNFLKSR